MSAFLALLIFSLGLTACVQKHSKNTFKVMAGSLDCKIEQMSDQNFREFQHMGVSADGKWMSVGWDQGKDSEGKHTRGAYILNLDTGEKIELAAPINHNSSYAPDGSMLVGAHYTPDGKTEIFEYHLATGRVGVIAPDPNWDFKPSYAPDGLSIVFNSYRSGNSEVYVYNRLDQTLKQITHHENYDAHGEFSPDGSKILFHRQVKKIDEGLYDFDLYSHDLETGTETRLTSTSQEESYGSWGPDGQSLVFSFNHKGVAGKAALFIREPDGGLSQLTSGEWHDSYAYWMRDGSYIYFNSDRSGTSEIYRMEMSGSECVKTG